MDQIKIHIISDSIGETGEMVVKALMTQFPTKEYTIIRHSHITEPKDVDFLLEQISVDDVVISTLVIEDIRNYLIGKATVKGLNVFDVLGGPIKQLERYFAIRAVQSPGSLRKLDEAYFGKIAAIEFTVKYDDGKDPRGIEKADIVLVGVSRTSKTPTSMYLANKGYKVVNIPLVPEIPVPKELFKVDSSKVIGLIIDPEKLNEIRRKRLQALGLSECADYAKDDRILKELNYAIEVFDKIKCRVIDVTESTIEGTASKIIDMVIKKH